MINLVLHDALNGNMLRVVQWLKQFSSDKINLVQVNDIPVIEKGIIVVVDLPLRPTSPFRVMHPKTENGQIAAQNIFDFVLDNLEVPAIFYGGYSVMDMLGMKFEPGKKRKAYKIRGHYQGTSYWMKSYMDIIPTNAPAKVLAESDQGQIPIVLKKDNIWCCNTVPYKFENWSGSLYKREFGFDIGDPISNQIFMKVWQP